MAKIDRRTRFITTMALTLGLGTALVGAFSAPGLGVNSFNVNQIWPKTLDMSEGTDSFRVGAMIAFNTPYAVGARARARARFSLPHGCNAPHLRRVALTASAPSSPLTPTPPPPTHQPTVQTTGAHPAQAASPPWCCT